MEEVNENDSSVRAGYYGSHEVGYTEDEDGNDGAKRRSDGSKRLGAGDPDLGEP